MGNILGYEAQILDLKASLARSAAELWERLGRYGPEAQKALIEEIVDYRTSALFLILCRESEKLAARDTQKAAGLATVADFMAERLPGTEIERRAHSSYAYAHLGNALRAPSNGLSTSSLKPRAWSTGNPIPSLSTASGTTAPPA